MTLDVSTSDIALTRRRIEGGDPLNWLLLNCDVSSGRLSLSASGKGGLLEMKSKIAGSPCFGFCRLQLSGRPRFVLINYIAESTSGVPRAHALVRSRQVASLFPLQDASITVDRVEDLTIEFVTTTIAEVDWSEPNSSPPPPRKDVIVKSLPLVPAEQQISTSEQSQLDSLPRNGVLDLFLRRKKEKPPSSFQHELDVPPPAPSKDIPQASADQPTRTFTTVTRDPDQCLNDKAPAIPAEQLSEPLELVVKPYLNEPHVDLNSKHQPAIPLLPVRPEPPLQTNKVSITVDPVERARRRAEKQRQVERAEQTAVEEEAARRSRLAKQRAAELRREAEEADARKAEMEALVKQAMAERKRKEMEDREEELHKSAELEEKKRAEKEKRMEQSRQSEERRKERTKLAEDLMIKEKQSRHQADEERSARIKLAKASVTGRMKGGGKVTGWVTVQTNESLTWRRRYFEFVGSKWMFYRSPQDTHTILDQIDLHNRVDSLREWFEGFEELKAIPHSFAIQFRDGQGFWSAFSDSEEEKYILLGLLLHASNL